MSGIRWMYKVYGETSVQEHGVSWGDGLGSHQRITTTYEAYGESPSNYPVGQVRLYGSGYSAIELSPEQSQRVRDAIAQLEAGTLRGVEAQEHYNAFLREVKPEKVEVGWKPLV